MWRVVRSRFHPWPAPEVLHDLQAGAFVRTETLVETEELSVVRVMGRPREPVDGRHRKALVSVGVEVSNAQLIWLLRDAANRLAKTLGVTSE